MEKYSRTFKIIIILLLLLLLINISIYKLDNCNKCKFKINNKELKTNQFMQLYFDKCLKGYSLDNMSSLFQSNHSAKP